VCRLGLNLIAVVVDGVVCVCVSVIVCVICGICVCIGGVMQLCDIWRVISTMGYCVVILTSVSIPMDVRVSHIIIVKRHGQEGSIIVVIIVTVWIVFCSVVFCWVVGRIVIVMEVMRICVAIVGIAIGRKIVIKIKPVGVIRIISGCSII